jgi:hypothetical protein
MLYALILALYCAARSTSTASPFDEPPGALPLLPGYVHRSGGDSDTRTGSITRADGFVIRYDIGRFAGVRARTAREVRWRTSTKFRGNQVEVAFANDRTLHVSFVQDRANFFARVTTDVDLAEMLLMTLGYAPRAPDGPER